MVLFANELLDKIKGIISCDYHVDEEEPDVAPYIVTVVEPGLVQLDEDLKFAKWTNATSKQKRFVQVNEDGYYMVLKRHGDTFEIGKEPTEFILWSDIQVELKPGEEVLILTGASVELKQFIEKHDAEILRGPIFHIVAL